MNSAKSMNSAKPLPRWMLIPLVLGIAAPSGGTCTAAETHALRSGRQAGDQVRVELMLEVGGDLKVAEEGKIRTLKMSVVGHLSYDEKLLVADGSDQRSVRHYEKAEAVIKVEDGGMKPQLRAERRRIGVQATDVQSILFSPQGPLTREELDLIDVPGNSLLLDELLPDKPVAVGQDWGHSEGLLAGLLGLDAVSHAEVRTVLKEVDAHAARLELSGNVQGAVGGVATEIELSGRYKFDLARRRITWFALLIKEKRSIGHVGPGMDIVARLQMTVAPGRDNSQLRDEVLKGTPLEPRPELLQLSYESVPGKFRFQHDRHWHVMVDTGDVLALRMVDRGELIAQCNVSSLPRNRPGTRPTLANFQKDIRSSLQKHFERFLQASETTNALGYAVYRVVAVGKVAELPIQWNYYLVSDDAGNQVVFAFTTEANLAELIAEADQAMVMAVQFVESAVSTAAKPTVVRARK
jgi:hypothetical protein